MTVTQLIVLLQDYPGDRLVIVDGYEGGYSDIKEISTIEVQTEKRDYNGDYEDWEDWYYEREEQKEKINAVLLSR